MTQIRCNKQRCSYNYKHICRADGITIGNNGECESETPVYGEKERDKDNLPTKPEITD